MDCIIAQLTNRVSISLPNIAFIISNTVTLDVKLLITYNASHSILLAACTVFIMTRTMIGMHIC